MSFFDKLKDLKQAREIQAQLGKEQVIGTSSNGLFKVTLDGNQNVVRVEIDEKVVGDRHQLEKSAKEAFSRALDSLKKLMVSKFSSIMK
ncbi:YbaB/EbfC family nucleoid-associated protein [Candidatus Uhrbacteria bacterium]|nr:YbaB/EbfC family nucleoid-associated protein [Candidatus Uhrbacteria bacterium]